jgi:hypothetical protein
MSAIATALRTFEPEARWPAHALRATTRMSPVDKPFLFRGPSLPPVLAIIAHPLHILIIPLDGDL